MRWVWALRHHTGAQYSVVNHSWGAGATTAICLKSATHYVNFLRSDSRCRRYVSDLSNGTLRYLGSEQKRTASLLRWKTANTVFVVLSFSFQAWRYSLTVAMSLSTPSTVCQSPSAWIQLKHLHTRAVDLAQVIADGWSQSQKILNGGAGSWYLSSCPTDIVCGTSQLCK